MCESLENNPTQLCILGNGHGLKVIIHSLWFDNPLLCVAASWTNQVGYNTYSTVAMGCGAASRANHVGYITLTCIHVQRLPWFIIDIHALGLHPRVSGWLLTRNDGYRGITITYTVYAIALNWHKHPTHGTIHQNCLHCTKFLLTPWTFYVNSVLHHLYMLCNCLCCKWDELEWAPINVFNGCWVLLVLYMVILRILSYCSLHWTHMYES